MSKTICIHPFFRCAQLVREYIQAEGDAACTNDMQRRLFEYLDQANEDLSLFSSSEMKTKVDSDVKEINSFLKDEGFDIELKDLGSPDAFYLATITKILVEWLDKGNATTLYVNKLGTKTKYDFVRFDKKSDTTSFTEYNGLPVAHLETKSGDTVHIAFAEGEVDNLDLFEVATTIQANQVFAPERDLFFPMVDLDHEDDIGWVKNLGWVGTNPGGLFQVAEALSQTKFRMNEEGAKVENAMAWGMLRKSAAPNLTPAMVVDRPFIIWFTRKNQILPYFVGYIDESDWKRPEKL